MDDEPVGPRPKPVFPRPVHYHGDGVRLLFVLSALLVFLLAFTGEGQPFSISASIGIILLLVISAGITSPAQLWIHWVNLFIAIGGLAIFGALAITRIEDHTGSVIQTVFIGIESIIFLIALYLATRTLRGLMIGARPPLGR